MIRMLDRAISVPEEARGERIDAYLARILELSRSCVQAMLENGEIQMNSAHIRKNYKVVGGEQIVVCEREIQPIEALPQNIPLDIVYEDQDLLVINKAAGMVVHPAAGNPDGTLVNALLFHCGDSLSGINGMHRPGIVHRLDKDTSGLMLVAKNDMAHLSLAEQIREHTAFRIYHALLYGHLREQCGSVNAPIGRHKTDRKKMAVTHQNAREAITHYRVISEYRGFCHVECRLETGRTHQIRVHMAHLGHPVVGDPVYAKGRDAMGLSGQCLHSKCIEFTHPRTGERMFFESELPDCFVAFLHRLTVLGE